MGMREKLIELLDNFSVYDDWYTNGEIADHLIANDVVPVVRCKDCRKFTPFVEPYHAVGQCRRMNGLIQETDFCPYGERKDNG